MKIRLPVAGLLRLPFESMFAGVIVTAAPYACDPDTHGKAVVAVSMVMAPMISKEFAAVTGGRGALTPRITNWQPSSTEIPVGPQSVTSPEFPACRTKLVKVCSGKSFANHAAK